jgi:hypothetical protein
MRNMELSLFTMVIIICVIFTCMPVMIDGFAYGFVLDRMGENSQKNS